MDGSSLHCISSLQLSRTFVLSLGIYYSFNGVVEDILTRWRTMENAGGSWIAPTEVVVIIHSFLMTREEAKKRVIDSRNYDTSSSSSGEPPPPSEEEEEEEEEEGGE